MTFQKCIVSRLRGMQRWYIGALRFFPLQSCHQGLLIGLCPRQTEGLRKGEPLSRSICAVCLARNVLRGIQSAEMRSRSKTDLTSRLQLLANIVTYTLYMCVPLGVARRKQNGEVDTAFIPVKTVAWLGLWWRRQGGLYKAAGANDDRWVLQHPMLRFWPGKF